MANKKQEDVAATKKPAKKVVKHTPPRMTHKAVLIAAREKMMQEDAARRAKALDFGKSVALDMKRSARENQAQAEEAPKIVLSRRPTTRKAGKKTVKFAAADLKMFKKRLLAEREKALSGADAMKATGFNESGDREADGGDGTNQTLRLQALGQMGNISRTLQQIEEALHRVQDGSYGVCTVCGQLIRKPRLMNQPFVMTCMECQSELERAAK